MDAGFFDDAREALDEARRLRPDLPGLAATEDRLVAAQLGSDHLPATSPPARRRFTAAASIALAVGVGSWVMVGDLEGTSPFWSWANVTASSGDVAPVPDPSVSLAAGPEVASEPAPAPADDVRKTTPVGLEPAPATVEATPVVTPDPAAVAPAPEPPRASREGDTGLLPVLQVPASTQETTVPMPPPAASLPNEAPAVVAASGGAPASAAAAPASAVGVGPEIQVRAALSRYESAYGALSAAAARAVWPSVDSVALARAFDSLEWQRISLGSCAIAVTPDGRSARATCAGAATWTPKVGGGTTTEPRNWLFDLAHDGSEWKIVSATVR
jgi:hypothetical protein